MVCGYIYIYICMYISLAKMSSKIIFSDFADQEIITAFRIEMDLQLNSQLAEVVLLVP